MRCGFCGFEFDQAQAKKACEGCIMSFSCGLLKCPNCGYENTPDPVRSNKRRNEQDAK